MAILALADRYDMMMEIILLREKSQPPVASRQEEFGLKLLFTKLSKVEKHRFLDTRVQESEYTH